ncbi:IclR family transcriptional regulator [Pararoseomonas indoligenes]|uniref:IclR family transcriptional regulator n=1 Tax=Roseomonas indoligenes TaxID=2820811 RepID=A0A940MZP0_9PROT|nr:IclR family transcriptional regulator [Pararoseomonas indoligenes]MBP0494588.1 IclR family transcriptional regulator [Pararoseomonas indoligenes]
MSEDNEDSAYLSPPVQRASRLLRHIGEGDRVTNMAATARALGINRTTLLRLLTTLESERFIEPAPNGGWRIGLGLIGIAAQAFFSQDLVQTAAPAIGRLADQVDLSAHLGVMDGTEIVYVVRRTPENGRYVSNIRIGSRLPAHAANMGRIILAHLPPARVEEIFAGTPLPASTEQTPVTMEQLRARLDADRAEGLAWSDGFFESGISSVAAAIFDSSGAPVAALNVSGHTAAFEGAARRERIGGLVRETADEISRRLGWAGPATSHNTTKLKVVA